MSYMSSLSGFGGFGDAAPLSSTDPSGGSTQQIPMPQWDGAFASGFRSQVVATLQTLLNQHGAGLSVDGVVGPYTQRAVEQQLNFLAGSPSIEARRTAAPGPAGLTVTQVINMLQRAWLEHTAVTGTAAPANTAPSEAQGTVSMTPAQAAAMDRQIAGGSVWPKVVGAAGLGLVGYGLWRAAKGRRR